VQTSLHWLLELSGYDGTPEVLAARLTARGTAVQSIEPLWKGSARIQSVRVESCRAVKDKPSLSVCDIATGSGTRTVLCGAPNVRPGLAAVWVPPGETLPDGTRIESRVLYGVESAGMLCSEAELGLSDSAAGILELPADTRPGTPASNLFGDQVISFELTPNRPDCLSVFGLARELAALTGRPFRIPAYDRTPEGAPLGRAVDVSIEDAAGCPRYAVMLVEGLGVAESPWWLRQRLLCCGVRPKNNLVDVSNYVMMETGHPLHAFDFDRLARKSVVVRSSRAGEAFTTLDDRTHRLPADVVLITDGATTIGLGGIMGGKNTEVSDATRSVLLEAAYFDPRRIRRARKALGIESEAALRFEKGADPNMVPYALDRAAHLLASLGGGQVRQGTVDAYPEPRTPRTLKLRPRRANALLGIDLTAAAMAAHLSSIGLDVKGEGDLDVRVPTFRPDLEREIDLVEEVARLHGLENIPERERGGGRLWDTPDHDPRVEELIHERLSSAGFNEVVTGSLGTPAFYRLFRPDLEPVAITNPISDDLSHLRTGLLADLTTVAQHNFNHRNLDWRLYGLGTVFLPEGQGQPPREEVRLAMALAGLRMPRHFSAPPVVSDWFDLRGAIEDLCLALRVEGVQFVPAAVPGLKNGEAFECLIGNRPAGWAGCFDRRARGPWDIKEDLWLAELRLEALQEARSGDPTCQPLPRFPAVTRDLALVVAEHIAAARLADTIRAAAGPLLSSLDVFDVYRGKPLPPDTKSVAFNLVFQSSERSLEAPEVDRAFAAAVAAAQAQHGATLRQ
jgi:phenylalanyl-tRNA synthetase beta chain